MKRAARPTPGRVLPLEEALATIRAGDNVLLHSACAEPRTLVEGLLSGARAGEMHLKGLTLYALTYCGPDNPPPYADTALLEACGLRIKTFFPIPALRRAFAAGLADYIPASFASLPMLIRHGLIKPDVAPPRSGRHY